MLEVVCRVRKNVYSASLNSNIDASRQAVYDKLYNVELNTSQELVRYIEKLYQLLRLPVLQGLAVLDLALSQAYK